MREPLHTEPVQFYAPPSLVAALRAKASRDGRTLSEAVREALRRDLAEAV